VNSFLADGGDAFSILTQATNRVGGVVDLDALEAYLLPTISGAAQAPPATNRITVVP
jgi:5'-nucleotidase